MDVTPAIKIFYSNLPSDSKIFWNEYIQFGIIIVYNLCIGNITPPVGNTLFVGVKVGNLKIEEIIMGELIKYYAVIIIVLMLVTYLPQLSMYLPILSGLAK